MAHAFTETVEQDIENAFAELQARVLDWAKAKGWLERQVDVPEQVALCHSELSEALEAWRKKEPQSWTDDKGKPQGIASEYADVVIRLLHYSGLLGVQLGTEVLRKMEFNWSRPYRHGNKQG